MKSLTGRLGTITIPEVLAAMDTNMTGEVFTWMDGNKTVANDYGLDLSVMKVVNTWLQPVQMGVNNQDLTDLLIATNRDSVCMICIVNILIIGTSKQKVACSLFSSHSGPSNGWGIKEFMADTLNYKYHAA
ncbi:MAG: hypothetical protein R2784_12390 [Saprospiraceae bacterium]